jgi:hypothetical protein
VKNNAGGILGVEHLPSMHKVLGSIHSLQKNEDSVKVECIKHLCALPETFSVIVMVPVQPFICSESFKESEGLGSFDGSTCT